MDTKDIENLDNQNLADELDNMQEDESNEDNNSEEEIIEDDEDNSESEDNNESEEKSEGKVQPKEENNDQEVDPSIFESDKNPYKKKAENIETRYADSSRENTINQSILKTYKEQAILPTENSEITDEILQKRFPEVEIEFMSPVEKELAKKLVRDESREKLAVRKQAETQFNNDLNKSYERSIISQNKDEFLTFIESKIQPGIYPDVELLADAFEARKGRNTPAKVQKKSQGKSALEGTGYGVDKGKNLNGNKKLTASAATELMRTNPQKYNEMLIKGEIDMNNVDFDN